MPFQRLTTLAVVLALATPVSLFSETRSHQRTDMRALAADLERALGRAHVEVNGRPVRQAEARPTSARPTSVSSSQEAVVNAMNRERAYYGLPALRINERLALAAGDRMDDMFAKHYFNHVSPDGIVPWSWVQKRGYDYRQIGENLAVGYPSANAVVSGWMHSPGHRANVLGRGYDEVGVAIAAGSPQRGYGGPTVVALYGER